jgi:tetratricopeptide (TPR) repeat protein
MGPRESRAGAAEPRREMSGTESRGANEALSSRKNVWQRLLLPLLALLPLAAFGPHLGKVFIYYDDDQYLAENPAIQHGLTWAGARWAFTTGRVANWHPLTWLSHMADVSLFGMNPIAHHAMGLLWHVVNTLLLYLVFRRLTGSAGRSAWVAALFAVHPAHVESVAWAAERKDLLSTAFGLAAIWTYGLWVRERGVVRYLVVLILFAAGLMSKPMLVSLPIVLLLLDFWPLGRWSVGKRERAGLILEKTPLLLMAAASSVVTFLVQRAGGAVRSFESFPLSVRIGNALVAYAGYLKMFVWPTRLVVFYPHPGALPAWKVLGALLLLTGLSAGALVLRRQAPYLLVGWLWFLVMLFPVIGVVQVGFQAMADRYTYLPFVGLFVAVAWGVPAIVSRWRYGGPALQVAAVAVVAAAALGAAAQARYWKDSETLFLHAIAVTKNNSIAHNNLGNYYNETGRPAEALPHLLEAVRIDPEKPQDRNNLGVSLYLLGRFEEAYQEFSKALRLQPDYSLTLNNLARTRFVQGEIADAVRFYEAALVQEPEASKLRGRLALALLMEGKFEPALRQLERESFLSPEDAECRQLLADATAFQRNPDDPALGQFRKFLASAHLDASAALYARGKKTEAALHLGKAIELFPAYAAAHDELGTRLVKEGRLDEAEAEFQRALGIDPGLASAHNNLGYVFFLRGRRAAAAEQYLEAIRLQPDFPLARKNLEQAQATPVGK